MACLRFLISAFLSADSALKRSSWRFFISARCSGVRFLELLGAALESFAAAGASVVVAAGAEAAAGAAAFSAAGAVLGAVVSGAAAGIETVGLVMSGAAGAAVVAAGAVAAGAGYPAGGRSSARAAALTSVTSVNANRVPFQADINLTP